MDLGKSPSDSTLVQSITDLGVSVTERLLWSDQLTVGVRLSPFGLLSKRWK
jgi:hypothetical protein